MSTPITNSTSTRTGLCPHGLPPAACPICSSKSMSGAGKMKDSAVTKPIKNQWSWMKCYAVGLALKANEARQQNSKTVFEKQLEFAKQLKQNIQDLALRIKNNIANIQKSLPNILSNSISIISSIIIFPILNLIMQIPKIIEQIAILQHNISKFINNVIEKLTAIIGDLKNFLNRNFIEKFKKKVIGFFSFFISDLEDENYKNDDTLAVFKSREIKKFMIKIVRTKFHDKPKV